MKTHELSAYLGVATSTIRTWTSGEFKQYLSPTGQGSDGRVRNFTAQDARIVAFIAALINESRPREEIHTALKRLQSEDWIDLPPMPSAPPGVDSVAMIPEMAAQVAVNTQRSSLLREVAIYEERAIELQNTVDELRQQLEEERGQSREREQSLLTRAIEAETELKLYRAGRLKPEG